MARSGVPGAGFFFSAQTVHFQRFASPGRKKFAQFAFFSCKSEGKTANCPRCPQRQRVQPQPTNMTTTIPTKHTSASLILRDTRHGNYYNRDLGGFSETDPGKATRLDNDAQVAFIKAHFQCPEFIETVPVSQCVTSPTPNQISKSC